MKNIFNYAIVVVFLICSVTGCGSKVLKTDYVEGTVTYKGEPVITASLAFSPVKAGEGHPAYGITDKSGIYKIQTFLGAPDKGTTPGEYIVTVSKSIGVPTGQFGIDPEGNRIEFMNAKSVLPLNYRDTATSPLRATVTSGGPNKFDFELVGEPPK